MQRSVRQGSLQATLNARRSTLKCGTFAWLILILLVFGVGAGPSSRPVGERGFAKDLIRVIDPGDPWQIVDYKPEGNGLVYVTTSHDAEIAVALLPKDASVDPGVADNVAVAIIKKIRADRAKAGVKVILAAKSEKDSRFAVRIHEKYMVGKSVADQLHLYKSVGPRVLMLTVNSVADDADVVAAEHLAGETLLVGARFDRGGGK